MLKSQNLSFVRKYAYKCLSAFQDVEHIFKLIKIRNSELLNPVVLHGRMEQKLAFTYDWLKFDHQKCAVKFIHENDNIHGGTSKCEFGFDKSDSNGCFLISGNVDASDKERLVCYPYIGARTTFLKQFDIAPFKTIQVEARTDGLPLEVYIDVVSPSLGIVNIYGLLISKETGWNIYEIPLTNMVMRGTEEDYHSGNKEKLAKRSYLTQRASSSIFTQDFYSTRRLFDSDLHENELKIEALGFRLMSDQSEPRSLRVRSIKLCHRSGHEQFLRDYKSPYFYIVDNEPDQSFQEKHQEELGNLPIKFLNRDFTEFQNINTGDITYFSGKE